MESGIKKITKAVKEGALKKGIMLFFVLLSFNCFAATETSLKFDPSKWALIGVLFVLAIVVYAVLNYSGNAIKEKIKKDGGDADELKTAVDDIQERKRVFGYISAFILFFFVVYQLFLGSKWESHVGEWLNLVVRWMHVIFGIAWIGASFYFNFLENSLNRTEGLRDEIAGNLWAVHGGGFYFLEKYKVAPKELPKKLHWFKYEAYFTWLSGFTLLVIVYYLNAKVYLIDPEVFEISSTNAILLGVGSLIFGWVGYDTLCKSPLAKRPKLFWLILFVFIAGFAWLFLQVFSARAAYIHVGALIGTMMVGNVFRVIIPAQKAMVASAKKGVMPNPQLGKNGLLRSRHNNFLTLPVIFIMISNHFPSTYGNSLNWFILIGLSLSSVLVNQYLNKIDKGEKAVWIMPIAVIGMISLAFVSAPRTKDVCSDEVPATFAEVQTIIMERCVQCHSATPTDDIQLTAPNGVMFDTPKEIEAFAERIMNRAVVTKTMPQANKTGMTQAERNVLQCWIENGAIIEE